MIDELEIPQRTWNFDIARAQMGALVIGVLGIIAAAIGWFTAPHEFYFSYLMSYVFWLGVGLGSLSLLMMHHMTGGYWGWITRHIFESGTRTLYLFAILVVPIIIGMPELYKWMHQSYLQTAVEVQRKTGWLNPTGFIIRVVIYFAVWWILVFFLNRFPSDVPVRLKRLSGPGLIIHTYLITFAAVDWLMSLEPEWYSTMFGFIIAVGELLSAMGLAIIVLTFFSDKRPFEDVMIPKRFHDLGNLMLAFVILWAYTSFSQWLIIWAGNLKEEIPFYTHRLVNGWQWVAGVLVVFHFAVPFLLLLMRFVKKRAQMLTFVSAGLIFMRLVDIYWIVEPARSVTFSLTWQDIVLPIGMGGIWLWFFLWNLAKLRAPMAPVGG